MRVRRELNPSLALGCVVTSTGCVDGVVCVCCVGTSCVLGVTNATVVGGCGGRGGSPRISVLINGMLSGSVVNTIRGCSSVGVVAAKLRPDDNGRGGSGGGSAIWGCRLTLPHKNVPGVLLVSFSTVNALLEPFVGCHLFLGYHVLQPSGEFVLPLGCKRDYKGARC